jgi:hypothetical protein
MDRSAIAECPACQERWAVFHNHIQDPTDSLSISEIIETGESVEPARREERIIDNSDSSSPFSTKLTLSTKESQSLMLEKETTQQSTSKSTVGITDIVSLGFESQVQDSLKSKYGLSKQEERVYSRELQIDVPAHKKRRVIMQWKRTWQHGVVRAANERGELIEVKYKYLLGADFDLELHDI